MKEKDIAMIIRTASVALGRIAEIVSPFDDPKPSRFGITIAKPSKKALCGPKKSGKRAYTKKSAFWKNPIKKRGRPAKK